MLSPPHEGAGRLPGYDLSQPTEADARAALQRVFGAERGGDSWAQACRDAGMVVGRVDTAEKLQRANGSLAAQGGPAAVIARSIEIRMRTYARLAARAATTPAGGAR